jgi:hypothetical protein
MQRKNSAQGQDLMSALSHSRPDLPLKANIVGRHQLVRVGPKVDIHNDYSLEEYGRPPIVYFVLH